MSERTYRQVRQDMEDGFEAALARVGELDHVTSADKRQAAELAAAVALAYLRIAAAHGIE